MFRKDRLERRGGGVLLKKDTIPALKYSYRRKQIAMKPCGAN